MVLSNRDKSTKLGQERRKELRFPAVGIGLLYSPTQEKCLENPVQDLYEAAGVDMSLSGIAFEVDRPLKTGQKLIVLVESPNAVIGEKLLADVRWCKKYSEGHYRVGATIHASEQLSDPETDNDIQPEPIGKGPKVPSEIDLFCPACHIRVSFQLIGLQNGDWSKGILPIYNCPFCGSTRTITTILAYNRQRALQGK